MRTWHPATSALLSLSWTVLRKKSQQFSQQGAELLPAPPCKSLKNNLEAYRCWCAAWTSNPVALVDPRVVGSTPIRFRHPPSIASKDADPHTIPRDDAALEVRYNSSQLHGIANRVNAAFEKFAR